MYTPLSIETCKTVEEENSKQLAAALIAKGRPGTDRERTLQVFRATDVGLKRSQITRLLDELMPSVTASKGAEDLKRHRDCLRLILYGLVAAGYSHEWLTIPQQDKHFQAGTRYAALGLSRRRLNRVLDALEGEWLVKGRVGFLMPPLAAKAGKASQYYPTEKLLSYFAGCLYEFEGNFDLPESELVKFNKMHSLPRRDIEDQISLLTRYNAFMRDFSWAYKAPIIRVFSGGAQRGGRLHTPFQNLPKRTLPIRPNTLLSGCPIVEPDFSCNHFRLAAALVGEDVGDDPYKLVANLVGSTREKIKMFLTRVMGATNSRSKGGVMSGLREEGGISTDEFHAITNAFYRLYPWLTKHECFFNDTGARMQFFEGEVAIKIIAAALENKIPVLPVHDSFASQQQHQDWLVAEMESAWMTLTGTGIKPVIRAA